jgi:outer membrane usher protein
MSEDTIFVDRARLVEALTPVLDAQLLSMLQKGGAPPGSPTVALAEITGLGISAEYDPRSLQVKISVPPEKRKPGVLGIRDGQTAKKSVREKPADFSAYINLRGKAEVQTDTLWSVPLSVSVEPVVNLLGWVLEAVADVDNYAGWHASFATARLVKDFPPASLRLTAGTLFLPAAGFMSSPSLAGLEIVHNTSRYRPASPEPTVAKDITVSQPSIVDVSLNGRALRSFALDPGRYTINDIPLATGINELEIGGLRSTVPWDSRLLPAGEASWAASIGIPQWQLQPPIASGFFLYGLSPFVTTGVTMQAGMDRQTAGAEALLATPLGNVRAVAGLSMAGFSTPDFAGLLEYRLAFPGAWALPTVGLSAWYTGRTFLGPGATADANVYAWQLSASISQALPLGFGLTAGLGWQKGWDPGADATSLTLTIGKPVGRETSITFMASARFPQGAPVEMQGTITLTSSASNEKRSIGTNTSLAENSASMDLRAQTGKDPGAPVLFASFDGIPSDTGAAGGTVGVQFAPQFLDAMISDSFSASTNTLSLDAGMALVTAGGAVAISRPVPDSFAIIIPRENMADQRVVINQGAGASAVAAENGRPGVLAGLTSYAPTILTVEAPEAPPGTDPGAFLRTVEPSYRSGIAVLVGTRATLYAQGRITMADGKAAVYRVGYAFSQDDPKSSRMPFFTDENGVFQVYGLTPGNYEITLQGADAFHAGFSIPSDASGLFEIGSFQLPVQKGQ